MRNILLIMIVSLLYSCDNTNVYEPKQLNERITSLEQRMDSLTHTQKEDTGGYFNQRATSQHNRCQGITKKGAQCKRKAKTNGYCWQHVR